MTEQGGLLISRLAVRGTCTYVIHCMFIHTQHTGGRACWLCVSVCVRGMGSMLGVEYRQWCAGKKSNSQVWREELWSAVAANFDGVNIPTEANFKQPSWSHWMQSWKGTCRVSLHQSGQATSNTGQAAGFQHHSLSKTGKLPSFEKSWYCFNFYSKIYPYLPNRIVHPTPIDSLVFCKVHGSSQPIGILELEWFFPPSKSTQWLARPFVYSESSQQDATGLWVNHRAPDNLANSCWPRKVPSRQEGAPSLLVPPQLQLFAN